MSLSRPLPPESLVVSIWCQVTPLYHKVPVVLYTSREITVPLMAYFSDKNRVTVLDAG